MLSLLPLLILGSVLAVLPTWHVEEDAVSPSDESTDAEDPSGWDDPEVVPESSEELSESIDKAALNPADELADGSEQADAASFELGGSYHAMPGENLVLDVGTDTATEDGCHSNIYLSAGSKLSLNFDDELDGNVSLVQFIGTQTGAGSTTTYSDMIVVLSDSETLEPSTYSEDAGYEAFLDALADDPSCTVLVTAHFSVRSLDDFDEDTSPPENESGESDPWQDGTRPTIEFNRQLAQKIEFFYEV